MESEEQAAITKKRNVGLNYMSLTDWAGKDHKEEWLLNKMIPMGHLTLLSASQKVGKSTLARNLITHVVNGTEFLGRSVQRGKVLYLPLEESPGSVRKHFDALGMCSETDVVFPTTEEPSKLSGIQTRLVRDWQTLAKAIEQVKPVLVVIDPLVLFLQIGSVNSYSKVYEAFDPLLEIARTYHCAILLLHHESKAASGRSNVGQRSNGSTAIPGAVSTTISMINKGGVRMLESEGRDIEDFNGLVLSIDEHGVITAGESTWDDFITDKYAVQIIEALAVMSEPMAMVELQMLVEGDVKQVKSAIYGLIERGQIVHVSGRGVKGDPKKYGLPQTASTDSE